MKVDEEILSDFSITVVVDQWIVRPCLPNLNKDWICMLLKRIKMSIMWRVRWLDSLMVINCKMIYIIDGITNNSGHIFSSNTWVSHIIIIMVISIVYSQIYYPSLLGFYSSPLILRVGT